MTEPTARELQDWDRTLVWHPFTQMAEYEPLILVRGEGCRLWDIDGREYLDGVASVWCNVHGHRHPRIDEAIRRQLDRVAHVTMLGASNVPAIQLARRLVDLAPEGLDRVFFSDDGSTAVEAALKIAFQYWHQREDPRPEKTTFLALDDAYHGDTVGSVSVGGVDQFNAVFRPLMFDAIRVPAPNPYRPPRGAAPEHVVEFCLAELEKVLAREHHRVCAMVVEPLVQAAAGMVVHPPGFLRGVRELTRAYDVLLILDEVAVGMGRTGRMFACEHEGVAPDFLCLAKGITGGYLPLAATLTTETVWRAFLGPYAASRSFFHGHTYGGNPLAAAAALATLDIFEEEGTLAAMPEKTARLAGHLARIAELPHVGNVRQCGLLAGIELVRDRARREPYPWAERRGIRVCQSARREGVLLRPIGNVVIIMPPLSIRPDQLDRIGEAVYRGIQEATEESSAVGQAPCG